MLELEPSKRTLILVHGLWDNPKIFINLQNTLEINPIELFTPYLPHLMGRKSLFSLALDLDRLINDVCDPDTKIDLLGFSMGGIISRIWIQYMGGFSRVERFFSIGSPHKGTFLAQPTPNCLFEGIADMKRGSNLIRKLNSDLSLLKKVECKSYFCRFDLMVIPGWDAVLPIGDIYSLDVMTHRDLISHPSALKVLKEHITDFAL
tara:strand:- start:2893 stop:3507 length:615 start_codon:yes stop_codon:yes gene_type:complete